MYRKLEDERPPEAGPEETPVGECVCVCSEPTVAGEEPGPEVKQSTVNFPVWYDING